MILLEEFLSKLFSVGEEDMPPVWIYDGRDSINPADKEEGLLCVFKSCYIPSISLNEKVLRSQVAEIYWTPEGIALCVVDREDE